MSAEENADFVRRGYVAFNAKDLASLGAMFAADAVWYTAGSGVLSGTKRGRDAILAYFIELGTRSQGTYRAVVQDIVGGEEHTVGLHQNLAERNGRTIDQQSALVFVIRGGQYAEARELSENTASWDDFWS